MVLSRDAIMLSEPAVRFPCRAFHSMVFVTDARQRTNARLRLQLGAHVPDGSAFDIRLLFGGDRLPGFLEAFQQVGLGSVRARE